MPAPDVETALARVREIVATLPETSERLAHGSPSFYVREKRNFAMFLDDHHGDGRLALWCAAPTGLQAALTASEPERYFVPPYVGHRGWVGVRLDRDTPWEDVAGVLEDAFLERAPKTLLDRLAPPGAA
ncbi:MAG: hypothetical protein QOE28_2974 [Solirubrobacteraceae bacterium]|jgi:hypothetical protein|nr:hypothetical protein [Solirubrobacteraceae bacterium]